MKYYTDNCKEIQEFLSKNGFTWSDGTSIKHLRSDCISFEKNGRYLYYCTRNWYKSEKVLSIFI